MRKFVSVFGAGEPTNELLSGWISTHQIRVIRQLAPLVASQNFFLVGGTAITVYLTQRQSLDLGWFCQAKFDHPMDFVQKLRRAGIEFTTTQVAEGTLHGLVDDIQVSFWLFTYPFLAPLVYWEQFGIYLASLEDLAAMKLAAIAQRGSRKDFYDLYALGESVFSLEQMLVFYQRKFAIADVGHVLYGLVYFDDAEAEADPILLKPLAWEVVKRSIQTWVKQI